MTKAQRKDAFRRIGKTISRKDLLQGYDGFYQFEIRTVQTPRRGAAIRPSRTITQFERTRR